MQYVLSDIHGNEPRFDAILARIDLQPEDMLYVLGDVVDRYPHGIRLLQRIMAMPNAKMLLGNHEYMLLRAMGVPYDDNFDDGRAMAHWYRNGGRVTHDALLALPEQEREDMLAYLRGLPLELEVTAAGWAYRLVHGAPAASFDGDSRYCNPIHYAVWKRLEQDAAFPGGTLIFGHTPTRYYQSDSPMALWYGEGKIGIDCGCGYPPEGAEGILGRLACLRLEDGAVFYAQ